MKIISNVKLYFCSVCLNRHLCLPVNEFPQLSIIEEKFNHRNFLYFKKDDYIFKEGDSADGIFNIYHGNVKVYRIDENNKEIVLNNVTAGESIGFNSILNKHYVNYAKAVEDTFCCFLTISEVEQLIKKHQPIAEKILTGY